MEKSVKSPINILEKTIKTVKDDQPWHDEKLREGVIMGLKLALTRLRSEGFLPVTNGLPIKPIEK